MMTHAKLPGMVREAVTLDRMFRFLEDMQYQDNWHWTSIKGWANLSMPLVTAHQYELIKLEGITPEGWDVIEKLDHYLHDNFSTWADFA